MKEIQTKMFWGDDDCYPPEDPNPWGDSSPEPDPDPEPGPWQ